MTATWAELLTDPAVVAAIASVAGALGIGVLLARFRERLAAVEADRTALRTGLAAVEARLGDCDDRIEAAAACLRTDLAAIIDSLAVAQREVEARAAAARAGEQAEQAAALAALERRLRAVEARPPEDERFDGQRARLDRLDTALSDATAALSARLDAVTTGTSTLEVRIAELDAGLAARDGCLGALGEADAALADRVERMEAAVSTLAAGHDRERIAAAPGAWHGAGTPGDPPAPPDLRDRLARLEARQKEDHAALSDRLDALALALDAHSGKSAAPVRPASPSHAEAGLAMPEGVISVLRA